MQDGLRCLRNGVYILWLTSSPCDKNSCERFRGQGPSCFIKGLQMLFEFFFQIFRLEKYLSYMVQCLIHTILKPSIPQLKSFNYECTHNLNY